MTNQVQEEQNADIKALREAAERAKTLERENESLRRDQAFRRAGIDPDDKRVSYFVKGYEGEYDIGAIQTEARSAGFLAEPGPTSEQQESLAGQGRIADVVSQSAPESGQDQVSQLEQAFAEGGTAGLVQAAANLGIPLNDD